MEEVESLRNEITDQNDTSSVMQQQFQKQNDEVYILKKKLEEEALVRESVVTDLKNEIQQATRGIEWANRHVAQEQTPR